MSNVRTVKLNYCLPKPAGCNSLDGHDFVHDSCEKGQVKEIFTWCCKEICIRNIPLRMEGNTMEVYPREINWRGQLKIGNFKTKMTFLTLRQILLNPRPPLVAIVIPTIKWKKENLFINYDWVYTRFCRCVLLTLF